MIKKHTLLWVLSAFWLSPAQAADLYIPEPPVTQEKVSQAIQGMLTGGYAHTWFQDINVDPNSWYVSGAVVYNFDDLLNAQVDFSFISHQFGSTSLDSWHVGGLFFARDKNLGMIGVEGAYGALDLGLRAEIFKVGARAEYYLNDMVTLRGSGGYVNVNSKPNLPIDADSDIFYANVGLSFYVIPDLAFKLDGDYAYVDARHGGPTYDANFVVSGEAEYLLTRFSSNNVSVFTGGRYGEIESVPNQAQFFVGARVYFGPATTLVEAHRTGAVDTTNVFLDHMPVVRIP